MNTSRLTPQKRIADTILAELTPGAPPASTRDASEPPVSSGSGSLMRIRILPAPRDGAPAIDRGAEAERFERFECLERIGNGGEGAVWRAFDRDLGRHVAIKRAHSVDVERFAAEVRNAGALEHPAIVPVYDLGVDADARPYFIMRFVDGEPLSRVIERLAAGDGETHRLYCFERRVMIFRRLCEAVAFAHARGVLHCDIKPDNVMVGRFGEVFLTDWGIARSLSARGDRIICGTAEYMAPEQAMGHALDARTDVHGLAALVYELLALRPYIELTDATVVETILAIPAHRPRHPSDVESGVQPRVPMDLGWFVMQGLERDPGRRYPTVDAMLARLERRADGQVPVQCAQTLVKRSTSELVRLIERRPALLPLAFLVAIAAWSVALLR